MDKSKVIVFGMVAALATIGVVGILVLIALGRDTTAFVAVFLPLVGSIAAIGGLGTVQLRQGETLQAVAKNVNGNSTRMLDAIELLQKQLAAAPSLRPDVETAPAISDDTIASIRADVATLPSHDDSPSTPAHRALTGPVRLP